MHKLASEYYSERGLLSNTARKARNVRWAQEVQRKKKKERKEEGGREVNEGNAEGEGRLSHFLKLSSSKTRQPKESSTPNPMIQPGSSNTYSQSSPSPSSERSNESGSSDDEDDSSLSDSDPVPKKRKRRKRRINDMYGRMNGSALVCIGACMILNLIRPLFFVACPFT